MSYSLTKQLPSCAIEKRLLLELESYIQRKIAELAPPYEDIASALRQTFIVTDKFGSETLKSVEEFQRSYFPDDTERISIEGRSVGRNGLSIEIQSMPFKSGTKLSVRFDGSSAREVVTGITAEIISILGSYKTTNHWFHLLDGLPLGLILYVITIMCLVAFSNLRPSQMSLTESSVSAMIIGAVTMLGNIFFMKKFKPYSTFETRRNEKRKRQLNWIVLGVLGFILFTVVGVFLRLKLFGF